MFVNSDRVIRHPGFRCTWCARYYEDGPPLITVQGGPRAKEELCSDRCAYDAGWSKAVVARWESEALSGVRFTVYERPAHLLNLEI